MKLGLPLAGRFTIWSHQKLQIREDFINSLSYPPSTSLFLSPSLSVSLLCCLPTPWQFLESCIFRGWQHFKIEEAWSHCLERSCQKNFLSHFRLWHEQAVNLSYIKLPRLEGFVCYWSTVILSYLSSKLIPKVEWWCNKPINSGHWLHTQVE